MKKHGYAIAAGLLIAVVFVMPIAAQQAAPPAEDPDNSPAQNADYSGPAILTRGAGSLFKVPKKSLGFQPYAAVEASYDSGLAGLVIRPDGKPETVDSYGQTIGGGVTGYLRGKRDEVALNYDGSYNHFPQATYYNGTNQSLTLTYKRQLNRRWMGQVREVAGVSTRLLFEGINGNYGLVDPQFAGLPQNELFDNQVSYTSTLTDATYKKSTRLSFNFGGDFLMTRRRSSALFGYNVGRARADASYRLSRRTTITANYLFQHYEFTKSFGASDIHGVELLISRRMSRDFQFSISAGGERIETLGIGRVTIPPELQAIFGRSYGVEAVYRVNYIPRGTVQLTGGGRSWTATVQGRIGSAPGNGLYLTSRNVTGQADYTYTGLRSWTIHLGGSSTTYSSLAQTLGRYQVYSAGGSVMRNLWRSVYVNARSDWYKIDVENSLLKRDSYRASLGLTFTPKEFPLAVW